jgi:uncharacterized phage protein (TIGR02218 family)
MWRYTSYNKPLTVTYGGTDVTWTPAPISRDRLEAKGDTKGVVAHVKVALGTDVAQALLDEHATPMVVGIHRHQDVATAVPVLIAYGRVSNISYSGEWLELDIATDDAGLAVPFPRALIERTCQWGTYSPFCGVVESDFSFDTTILTFDRSDITVASIDGNPDNYYQFGQLVVTVDGAKERLYIQTQVGTDIHIYGALPTGVMSGDACTLIAGDDFTLATCKAKFDNVSRFTGFDQLPQIDPFFVGLR